MKKEWLTPELEELNVQETKDDCYEQVKVGGQEKLGWRCKYCGAKELSIPNIKHKPWCPYVGAGKGFGPQGPVTPELGATPLS